MLTVEDITSLSNCFEVGYIFSGRVKGIGSSDYLFSADKTQLLQSSHFGWLHSSLADETSQNDSFYWQLSEPVHTGL